jgi:hypothetical protein
MPEEPLSMWRGRGAVKWSRLAPADEEAALPAEREHRPVGGRV